MIRLLEVPVKNDFSYRKIRKYFWFLLGNCWMSQQKCVENFYEDLGILMNFLMECFKRNSVLDFNVKAFILWDFIYDRNGGGLREIEWKDLEILMDL